MITQTHATAHWQLHWLQLATGNPYTAKLQMHTARSCTKNARHRTESPGPVTIEFQTRVGRSCDQTCWSQLRPDDHIINRPTPPKWAASRLTLARQPQQACCLSCMPSKQCRPFANNNKPQHARQGHASQNKLALYIVHNHTQTTCTTIHKTNTFKYKTLSSPTREKHATGAQWSSSRPAPDAKLRRLVTSQRQRHPKQSFAPSPYSTMCCVGKAGRRRRRCHTPSTQASPGQPKQQHPEAQLTQPAGSPAAASSAGPSGALGRPRQT